MGQFGRIDFGSGMGSGTFIKCLPNQRHEIKSYSGIEGSRFFNYLRSGYVGAAAILLWERDELLLTDDGVGRKEE
jgi:hypothetical protein